MKMWIRRNIPHLEVITSNDRANRELVEEPQTSRVEGLTSHELILTLQEEACDSLEDLAEVEGSVRRRLLGRN